MESFQGSCSLVGAGSIPFRMYYLFERKKPQNEKIICSENLNLSNDLGRT